MYAEDFLSGVDHPGTGPPGFGNIPDPGAAIGPASVGPWVAANRGASGIDGVLSTATGFAAGLGRPVRRSHLLSFYNYIAQAIASSRNLLVSRIRAPDILKLFCDTFSLDRFLVGTDISHCGTALSWKDAVFSCHIVSPTYFVL